jgi:hypothetical protein
MSGIDEISIGGYAGATFGIVLPASAPETRKRKTSPCSISSPWYLTQGCPNFNVQTLHTSEDEVDEASFIANEIVNQKKKRRTNQSGSPGNNSGGRASGVDPSKDSMSDMLLRIDEEKKNELSMQDLLVKRLVDGHV